MAALFAVRGHEDLVLLGAGEPRPVAVVTLHVALVPRQAAVVRAEDRVVGQVDTGVVDAAALVLAQVGIGEAGVLRRVGGEARLAEDAPLPALAVVLRR